MRWLRTSVAAGALICASFFIGCGSAIGSSTAARSADVYVAGILYPSASIEVATYWKNGVATMVGGSNYSSYASAIAVSGDDIIYVAGAQGGPGNDVATYWKNGVAYPLTDGSEEASANAVFLSANDVYVAGGSYGFDASGAPLPGFAGYWKNGVGVNLDSVQGAQANSICVSGSDVYVAGATSQTIQTSPTSYYTALVATVWKNGVPTYLTDGLHFSIALSIFVSGTDVYVAGEAAQTAQQLDTAATYWKNGVAVTLPASPGSVTSSAKGVFVSGQDVYISGGDTVNGAEYWKDGTLVPLLGSHTGQIVVSGADVYVAGTNYPTSAIGPAVTSSALVKENATADYYIGATYWKDTEGVPLAQSAYTSSATAIAVVGP